MIDPYRGVLLNGKYYSYVSDSFRFEYPLRNETIVTQGSTKSGSALGILPPSFSLVMSLDTKYNVYAGSSFVGSTTWQGVSRLADLISFAGARGTSMPITFVTPYGATHQVLPVGALSFNTYNPDNPSDANGMEFRVSLTLDALA